MVRRSEVGHQRDRLVQVSQEVLRRGRLEASVGVRVPGQEPQAFPRLKVVGQETPGVVFEGLLESPEAQELVPKPEADLHRRQAPNGQRPWRAQDVVDRKGALASRRKWASSGLPMRALEGPATANVE